MLDKSLERLAELDTQFGPTLNTIYSTVDAIEHQVATADLVIGAVLVPGAAAPKLVTRAMLRRMRPGSVFVDIAIDQGGCAETSRPTSHDNPTYIEEGVIHYCVTNMPGAVPRTSTFALNNATLPFTLALADKGWRKAMQDDPHLANGVNVVAAQADQRGGRPQPAAGLHAAQAGDGLSRRATRLSCAGVSPRLCRAVDTASRTMLSQCVSLRRRSPRASTNELAPRCATTVSTTSPSSRSAVSRACWRTSSRRRGRPSIWPSASRATRRRHSWPRPWPPTRICGTAIRPSRHARVPRRGRRLADPALRPAAECRRSRPERRPAGRHQGGPVPAALAGTQPRQAGRADAGPGLCGLLRRRGHGRGGARSAAGHGRDRFPAGPRGHPGFTARADRAVLPVHARPTRRVPWPTWTICAGRCASPAGTASCWRSTNATASSGTRPRRRVRSRRRWPRMAALTASSSSTRSASGRVPPACAPASSPAMPTLIARLLRLRAYASPVQPLPLLAAATALWQDEAHVEDNRARYRAKFDTAAAPPGQSLRLLPSRWRLLPLARCRRRRGRLPPPLDARAASACCRAATSRSATRRRTPAPPTSAWRWSTSRQLIDTALGRLERSPGGRMNIGPRRDRWPRRPLTPLPARPCAPGCAAACAGSAASCSWPWRSAWPWHFGASTGATPP